MFVFIEGKERKKEREGKGKMETKKGKWKRKKKKKEKEKKKKREEKRGKRKKGKKEKRKENAGVTWVVPEYSTMGITASGPQRVLLQLPESCGNNFKSVLWGLFLFWGS